MKAGVLRTSSREGQRGRPSSSRARLQPSAPGLIVPGSRRLSSAEPAGLHPASARVGGLSWRADWRPAAGGRRAARACLFKGLGLHGCRAGGVRVASGVSLRG